MANAQKAEEKKKTTDDTPTHKGGARRFEKVIGDLQSQKSSDNNDVDHTITNFIYGKDFLRNGELRTSLKTLGSARTESTNPAGNIIRFVPKYDVDNFKSIADHSPEEILIHELKHAWNHSIMGTLEKNRKVLASDKDEYKINCEEVDAVNFQNIQRKIEGKPMRDNHGRNQKIPESNLIPPTIIN